jgi:hypothetical protein
MCGFSPAKNVIRLRKCLKGQARESVSMILIVADNDAEIIEILEQNFGRNDVFWKKFSSIQLLKHGVNFSNMESWFTISQSHYKGWRFKMTFFKITVS